MCESIITRSMIYVARTAQRDAKSMRMMQAMVEELVVVMHVLSCMLGSASETSRVKCWSVRSISVVP
jgi:hypothetical protein